MNEQLKKYITSLEAEALHIADERKVVLDEIRNYVKSNEGVKLNFICTHNSRRSHLSQIWAQTLADFFNIKIETYSGGTEATAFHPNAVGAIQRAGFGVEKEGEDNPHYLIKSGDSATGMVCFSKKFDDTPPNPSKDFAAIMTCSEADADCPLVSGASARIKLFYQDPKISDGTPEESATYDERCRQIATELYYVFSSLE